MFTHQCANMTMEIVHIKKNTCKSQTLIISVIFFTVMSPDFLQVVGNNLESYWPATEGLGAP